MHGSKETLSLTIISCLEHVLLRVNVGVNPPTACERTKKSERATRRARQRPHVVSQFPDELVDRGGYLRVEPGVHRASSYRMISSVRDQCARQDGVLHSARIRRGGGGAHRGCRPSRASPRKMPVDFLAVEVEASSSGSARSYATVQPVDQSARFVLLVLVVILVVVVVILVDRSTSRDRRRQPLRKSWCRNRPESSTGTLDAPVPRPTIARGSHMPAFERADVGAGEGDEIVRALVTSGAEADERGRPCVRRRPARRRCSRNADVESSSAPEPGAEVASSMWSS